MSADFHEHRLLVRYSETDQMGVAHHASYLVYMEEGRTHMMKDRGCSYADLEAEGIGLPLRRLEVRYRRSALYEQELVVQTRVKETRAASITFEYEIRRAVDGELLCTGWTELACIDLHSEARRIQHLPEKLRELLT